MHHIIQNIIISFLIVTISIMYESSLSSCYKEPYYDGYITFMLLLLILLSLLEYAYHATIIMTIITENNIMIYAYYTGTKNVDITLSLLYIWLNNYCYSPFNYVLCSKSHTVPRKLKKVCFYVEEMPDPENGCLKHRNARTNRFSLFLLATNRIVYGGPCHKTDVA